PCKQQPSHVHTPMYFFFSSRRRHTISKRDWSSDVCSSDLPASEASPPASALPPQAVRAIPAAKPSAASETSRFLRTFTASPFGGVRPEAVHRGGVTAGRLGPPGAAPPGERGPPMNSASGTGGSQGRAQARTSHGS